MRPAARLQAAIEIVDAILAAGAPPDRVLAEAWRQRRYAGVKDRAAVAGLVYDILRRWGVVAALASADSGARAAVTTLLACSALPGDLDLAAAFAGGPYGPAPLTQAEASPAERLARDRPTLPAWALANLPPWLETAYRQRFGEDLAAETAALNRPAPLDLRVNRLKSTREAALDELAAAGIAARPTPFSPLGLRLTGHARLRQLPAYREGRVEVQDEGSQIAALLVAAAAGETVVDLCAGAGGKSLAMAAEMANRGRLLCFDPDPARLAEAERRLALAGATMAQCIRLSADGRELSPFAGIADRVLVDAPCSGSGTSRRDPLVTWRLQPADLQRLPVLQGQLLDRAAALLRPGGRLVYVTCSLLAAENEAVVAAFLARDRRFQALQIGPIWQGTLQGPPPAAADGLLLTPLRHGTDGFFVAAMSCRGSRAVARI